MAEQNDSGYRDIILFFLIAYGFSWMLWIPEALANRGLLGSSILVDFLLGPYNPAAWGPFVSAFLLTFYRRGSKGVLQLLKKGVDYRFDRKWWIPTLLLCPLIIGGALFFALIAGNTIPELDWISDPALILIQFVIIFFTGGPLQEEFGWRGYALPRLQKRYNAVISSIIVGFLWGLWHLPYTLIGTEITHAYGIIPEIITAILLSVLFTWLFNNTKGSVLVALLFHNMFNWSNYMFPALQTPIGSPLFLTFFITSAIIVIIFFKSKNLVRESKNELEISDGLEV